jgi:hypothetical protein
LLIESGEIINKSRIYLKILFIIKNYVNLTINGYDRNADEIVLG